MTALNNNINKIMVFDVETTGLLDTNKKVDDSKLNEIKKAKYNELRKKPILV
jgi:hypothetical protein